MRKSAVAIGNRWQFSNCCWTTTASALFAKLSRVSRSSVTNKMLTTLMRTSAICLTWWIYPYNKEGRKTNPSNMTPTWKPFWNSICKCGSNSRRIAWRTSRHRTNKRCRARCTIISNLCKVRTCPPLLATPSYDCKVWMIWVRKKSGSSMSSFRLIRPEDKGE